MNERDEMYDINGGQLHHLREPQVMRQQEARAMCTTLKLNKSKYVPLGFD